MGPSDSHELWNYLNRMFLLKTILEVLCDSGFQYVRIM